MCECLEFIVVENERLIKFIVQLYRKDRGNGNYRPSRKARLISFSVILCLQSASDG
jgi:hypothetical protein